VIETIWNTATLVLAAVGVAGCADADGDVVGLVLAGRVEGMLAVGEAPGTGVVDGI
jgi:hypothetical protein